MSHHEPDNPSFSLGRKYGLGLSVLIACLSVLALTAMINYLSARHHWRWDATTSAKWALSPRTLRVLEAVTNEIQVIVYYSAQERLYEETVGLLREYCSKNPLLKLQIVDPYRSPVEANLIKTKYQLAAMNEKDLVIFDNKKRVKKIYHQALSDYDLEPVFNSSEQREFRRRIKPFRGEQLFTAAIAGVISPKLYKACFLNGHGELDPSNKDEATGYSKFLQVLADNNFQAEFLSLLGSSEVPADCSLLIIPAPTNPLTPEELTKIENYLNNGGRLFVLFGYNSFGKRIGLEDLLAGWGVIVGESFVLDPPNSTPNSRGYDILATISDKEPHAITRPLYQQAIQVVLPRGVSSIKSQVRGAETLKVDELLHTSPNGIRVSRVRSGLPDINPATDPRGVFSLMAAVEKGTVAGIKADRGSTRIVVSGDAMFLNNQLIESGANRDFATHAVNWLVDQSFLMAGVGPREVREYKLNLTSNEMMVIKVLLLGALPGAALLAGFFVSLRRRN